MKPYQEIRPCDDPVCSCHHVAATHRRPPQFDYPHGSVVFCDGAYWRLDGPLGIFTFTRASADDPWEPTYHSRLDRRPDIDAVIPDITPPDQVVTQT